MFIAGIVLLLRKRGRTLRRTERYGVVVLLILPFILNYAAALFDLYPYGGTRHCIYLAIFAIAAVSACIVWLAGQNTPRAVAISAFIIVLCFTFRTNHAPYIARADQNRAHMDRAVRFIQEEMPASDPILADFESGIELGHYLCEQKPVSYDGSIPGFLVFYCGGHRVIATIPDVWAFTLPVFLSQWAKLVQSGYLKSGEDVWVVQAGWMVKLDEELRKEFPEFRDLKTQAFGNNIRFSKLTVGQSMPPVADSSETIAPEPR